MPYMVDNISGSLLFLEGKWRSHGSGKEKGGGERGLGVVEGGETVVGMYYM